jgi:hypothetical protein
LQISATLTPSDFSVATRLVKKLMRHRGDSI